MQRSARTCNGSLAVLLGIVAVAAGCSQEATVRLRLAAPSDPLLNPLDDLGLANLTLIVAGERVPTQSQTRAVPGKGADGMRDAFSLGDVPLANGLRLTVVATTAAGRMIGFGRGAGPVDVGLGDDIEVVVPIRLPFAYLTGGPELIGFDSTLDPTGADYARDVQGGGAATAVAVTPDGADLVVASAGQLGLISTETHAPAATAKVTLQEDALDLSVSPDGRYVLVAHATGVSVVSLPELRAGSASATFLSVGSIASIAVSGATAWALRDASNGDTCGQEAALVAIDLAALSAAPPVLLGRAAADLAVDADSGQVLIALPCDNQVARLRPGTDAGLDVFMNVDAPTTVAAGGGRVWALGHKGGAGAAQLVLAQQGLDGSGSSVVTLSVPEERAQVLDPDFQGPGQSAEQRISADAVHALDLAVLPDGSRLAIVVEARYESEPVGPAVFPYSHTVPGLRIDTSEYQLLDSSTGAPLQRYRTFCKVQVLTSAFLNDFGCIQAAGQDALSGSAMFKAGDVAVLYGDR